MNKSIIKTASLVAGMLFTSLLSMAQGVQDCPVTLNELYQSGDSVIVLLDMDLAKSLPLTKKSYDITPVITNGTESLRLPKVSVKDRRSYMDYKRQVEMMTEKERRSWSEPFAVVRSRDAGQLSYRYAVPFETWMHDAWLDVTSDACACGTVAQSVTKRVADNIKLEDLVLSEPALAYLQPKAEQVKQREMTGESYLEFVVDKTDIRQDYRDNARELARIRDLIGGVVDDKDITVRHIEVSGFASPEGTLAHNKVLSENRAKALCDYIKEYYGIPSDKFSVNFGGENWDGLVALLENSDLKEKDQILEVIRTIDIQDGREKRIMDISGGVPYKYMLQNWFPGLRKAVCKIDYDVRNYTVEETRMLIGSKPQNLSLNEMFQLASTYEAGSEDFNEIMGVAVRMYPDDQTANLNAANAALAIGDLRSAEKYLQKAGSGKEATNAMGVFRYLQGDRDAALQLFRQAVSQGLSEAQKNIDQITYHY